MEIGLTLDWQFPNSRDYEVSVDPTTGQQRITSWNSAKLGPHPTDQQLSDAWIPALKAQKVAEIRAHVVSECEALMPVYEMLYVIRARVVDPRLAQMDQIAKKGRDLEVRVNAAATEADMGVVVW